MPWLSQHPDLAGWCVHLSAIRGMVEAASAMAAGRRESREIFADAFVLRICAGARPCGRQTI
jgi:hypothetical protein